MTGRRIGLGGRAAGWGLVAVLALGCLAGGAASRAEGPETELTAAQRRLQFAAAGDEVPPMPSRAW